MTQGLEERRVLVGVGGSVAAFKAATVVTDLRQRGAIVHVAMTPGAQHFLTPLSLQSLSGHPVATSLWEAMQLAVAGEHGMTHLSLAGWAEIQLIVGASANLIARLALGFADDAVTATALACTAPLVVAPAMESAMWRHPATQANISTLVQRGAHIVGPVTGRLASGKNDEGRMAEPEAIVAAVEKLLA